MACSPVPTTCNRRSRTCATRRLAGSGPAFLLENGPQLASHQFGQCPDWDQKTGLRLAPSTSIIGNAASSDKAMDMRVIEKLLGPGMENSQHANGRTDKARIAGELDDRPRRSLHQGGVAVALVAS